MLWLRNLSKSDDTPRGCGNCLENDGNHMLPHHGEENANVVMFELLLSCNDNIKDIMLVFMGSCRTSLYRIKKLKNQ